MALPRLTPHQRWALQRLATVQRLSGTTLAPGSSGWASVRDTGSPTAMEHLCTKGYAERSAAHGPRGGTVLYYRLSPQGEVAMDHIHRRGLKVGGR